MKIYKNTGYLIIGLFSFLFVLLNGTFFLFVPLGNNYKLNKQEIELIKIELPTNTQFIEAQSVCGKLNGNGNGMNYLSTILIRSNLSLTELKNYYSNYKVMNQNSAEFENDCLEHDSIMYSKLKNITDYKHYYVVYTFTSAEFGSIWEMDLRGH